MAPCVVQIGRAKTIITTTLTRLFDLTHPIVTRVSGPIKYMTQSNWSHAALYVGPVATDAAPGAEPRVLIEADLPDGARGAAVHARPPAHPHLPPGLADAGRGRAARSRRHGVPGPAL